MCCGKCNTSPNYLICSSEALKCHHYNMVASIFCFNFVLIQFLFSKCAVVHSLFPSRLKTQNKNFLFSLCLRFPFLLRACLGNVSVCWAGWLAGKSQLISSSVLVVVAERRPRSDSRYLSVWPTTRPVRRSFTRVFAYVCPVFVMSRL